MQPTQLLPIADLSAIDTAPLAGAPASPATRNLAAAFAELLGDNIDSSGPLPGISGERLPESGNILPVPPDSASDAPIDPEEIVASLQRELENLTDEQVTLAGGEDELQAPEIDVDIQVVTETLKPTPTPAPPTPIITLPQTVDTLEIVSETGGKSPAEQVLPPAAPLPVELPKTTTPPAPPIVVLPQGQAEIRQALPREPGPVRPAAAPTAPANATGSNGAMEIVHTRTLTDAEIDRSKGNPAPSKSIPVLSADAAASEKAPSARPLSAAPTDTATLSVSAPAAAPAVASPGAAEAASIAALAATAGRGATPLPAAAVPTTLTTAIDLPVQESGWDKAIAERVVMMASNKLQNAEIRLTPADLGPLRVQLAIEDGAARVSFAAQHALTRDAIEQALPRLREMLAETGLTLGEASVGDEGLDYPASRDTEGHAPAAAVASEEAVPESDFPADAPQVVRASDGLVDTFV